MLSFVNFMLSSSDCCHRLISVDTVDQLLGQLQQVQEFCLRGQLECPSSSYREECFGADSIT